MATAPTLDDRTATAIREAIAAARSGRIGEAFAIGQKALADGGDTVALNAMLGMLRCGSGDIDAGIAHLRIAHSARPDDAAIATNLVAALAERGDHTEALGIATLDRAIADPSLRLAHYRGFLAQALEQYEVAIEAYRHSVNTDPKDFDSWNNLGNALGAIGEADESIAALERSVAINSEAAPSRFNLAMALRDAGRLDEAELQLRSMAVDFADDARPLIELHAMLKAQGREESIDPLEQAVERDPRNRLLLLALATERVLLLRMAGVEDLYRRVIENDRSNVEAHVGLAIVFEHSNASEALRSLIDEAERNGVDSGAVQFIRAFALRRDKDFAKAFEAMQSVPADLEPIRRAHLIGQCLEGMGRFSEAFDAFTLMNEQQAQDPVKPLERAEESRNRIARETALMTTQFYAGWKSVQAPGDRPSPAFLIGFPRSGTTLLDTMLMGHRDVEVIEERPTLATVERLIGGFEAIANLTADQIAQARDCYFEEAAKHVALSPGKLLVDKSPLFMNKLPLIHRLFPDARIILALRHPCDVVLSCFTSNFRLNSGMVNFLRLGDAADFYDLSFGCLENTRALLPVDVRTVVYEKLVEDSEGELRALTDWLGLTWRSEMLDHQRTASARGLITTASYAQVTEPLYQRSVGRWKNYRAHLEPVLPTLLPWVEKFGYSL